MIFAREEILPGRFYLRILSAYSTVFLLQKNSQDSWLKNRNGAQAPALVQGGYFRPGRDAASRITQFSAGPSHWLFCRQMHAYEAGLTKLDRAAGNVHSAVLGAGLWFLVAHG